MRRPPSRVIARASARIGAGIIIICVAVLAWGYLSARFQEAKDKQLVSELQKKVQMDATLAPVLAKEHDRITKARSARKSRDNIASIVLIAGVALFLSGAKWLVAQQGRRAPLPQGLVHIREPRQVASAPRDGRVTAVQAAPLGIDLSAVDEIISAYGRGQEAAIPILQAIQSHFRYLPTEALEHVCAVTEITPAQISGTSSFYAHFRRSPVGKHIVRVCHGTACHVSGAKQITEELRRHLGILEGEDTDPERMFTLDKVACLGCCSLAPVLMLDDHTAGRLTPRSAVEVVDAVERKEFA